MGVNVINSRLQLIFFPNQFVTKYAIVHKKISTGLKIKNQDCIIVFFISFHFRLNKRKIRKLAW